MAKATQFTYTYEHLAKLAGMPANTVHQHTRRGNLRPGDLASVLIWLARHGKIGLRLRIVHAALLRELPMTSGQRPASRKARGRTRRQP